MEFRLKVNGNDEDIVLDVAPDGGAWVVSTASHQHQVTCERLDAHHCVGQIDGRQVSWFVSGDKQSCYVVIDGVTYQIEESSRNRRRAVKDKAGDVTPPMPGAIIRILVKAGEEVEAGQGLLVLSAMKMETTIVAPTLARIKKVLVSEGEQVVPGQQLFEWEALPPSPTTEADV